MTRVNPVVARSPEHAHRAPSGVPENECTFFAGEELVENVGVRAAWFELAENLCAFFVKFFDGSHNFFGVLQSVASHYPPGSHRLDQRHSARKSAPQDGSLQR